MLRDHALGHLRAIAHLGGEAAKAAREKKKAQEVWEQTGQVMEMEPLCLHEAAWSLTSIGRVERRCTPQVEAYLRAANTANRDRTL